MSSPSSSLPPIFFVIGPPGVGKGSVCEYVRQVFNLHHICAGDMLRDEVKRGSDLGKNIIGPILAEGKIVPSEVTLKLLQQRIVEALQSEGEGGGGGGGGGGEAQREGRAIKSQEEEQEQEEKQKRQATRKQGILLDGFPRKIDQSKMFEADTCRARGVVYFECSQQEMERRLLARGRADDTPEIIRRRFAANLEQCEPVKDMFREEGRLFVVDTGKAIDEVCAFAANLFTKEFGLAVVNDKVAFPAVASV